MISNLLEKLASGEMVSFVRSEKPATVQEIFAVLAAINTLNADNVRHGTLVTVTAVQSNAREINKFEYKYVKRTNKQHNNQHCCSTLQPSGTTQSSLKAK